MSKIVFKAVRPDDGFIAEFQTVFKGESILSEKEKSNLMSYLTIELSKMYENLRELGADPDTINLSIDIK